MNIRHPLSGKIRNMENWKEIIHKYENINILTKLNEDKKLQKQIKNVYWKNYMNIEKILYKKKKIMNITMLKNKKNKIKHKKFYNIIFNCIYLNKIYLNAIYLSKFINIMIKKKSIRKIFKYIKKIPLIKTKSLNNNYKNIYNFNYIGNKLKTGNENFYFTVLTGIKLIISGRLVKRKTASRSKINILNRGRLNFSSFNSFMDINNTHVINKNGSIGIKVYMNSNIYLKK